MQDLDERTKAIINSITVLAVIIAGMFGIKIDEGQLVTVLSAAAVLVAALYGLWKNMNFTAEAAKAQELLDTLKGKR